MDTMDVFVQRNHPVDCNISADHILAEGLPSLTLMPYAAGGRSACRSHADASGH
jgi:hypothetical protein